MVLKELKRTSNKMEAKCINENGLFVTGDSVDIGNGHLKLKIFKISVKWFLMILGVFD
jgi:hypothetical protein